MTALAALLVVVAAAVSSVVRGDVLFVGGTFTSAGGLAVQQAAQ